MDRKFMLTPRNLLYAFIIAAVPFVAVCGVSVIPANLRYPAIVAVGAICIFTALFLQKKITLDGITVPLILLCGMILLSYFYSVAPSDTMEYLIVYCCFTAFVLVDFPEKLYDRIITVIKAVCLVIGVSIILSVFIDDFILKYFSFIINPNNRAEIVYSIHSEINNAHAYSGLAKERAEAAYIMNVGIAIMFAKYFAGDRFKTGDVIMLGIFVSALLLTNKRTLFIVPVVCFLVFMLFSKIKSKVMKFSVILLIALCAFAVLSIFIPQLNNIFDRLFVSDRSDYLSGRNTLWIYSFNMFAQNPILGRGFASYNAFANVHGLRVKGEEWYYFGHNCYFEVLGEVGIVGAIIFLIAFLVPLILTFRILLSGKQSKKYSTMLFFSLYIQLMFFIYSLSGNVIYYNQQVMMWFFAIALTRFVRRQQRENDYGGVALRDRIYE